MNQARRFAARVVAETPGGGQAARIDHAFLLALGRLASDEERGLAGELLKRQLAESVKSPQRPLEHLCHMLLNTNEFLYVP